MHHDPRVVRPWLSLLGATACSLAGAQTADEIFPDDFESCRAPTQFIYAIDISNALLRFDPTALASTPIQSLGALTCSASSPLPGWLGGTVPVSTSVDRDGNIWVLYSSGELFTVDPVSLACTRTSFVPQQNGFDLFMMAFAGPGGPAVQTAYISGGSVDLLSPGKFGLISHASLQVQSIGSLAGSADFAVPLAGTGDLALYGLYIETAATTYIREIDRASGATFGTALPITGIFDANTAGWAFAFWGGKFWIFTTEIDPITSAMTTSLHSVDRSTGTVQVEIADAGAFTPIAAGSSTCVPVTVP